MTRADWGVVDFKAQRAFTQTQEMPAAPALEMLTEYMPPTADDMATQRLPPRDASDDDDIARLKAEDV